MQRQTSHMCLEFEVDSEHATFDIRINVFTTDNTPGQALYYYWVKACPKVVSDKHFTNFSQFNKSYQNLT